MNYHRSIKAMFRAGRIMATAVTFEQKAIAERYINLAVRVCERERPPFEVTFAAYNDGLKGKRETPLLPGVIFGG